MDLSRVSILCFAASYGVAFVLEVTRLFFRSAARGAVMLGFAGAGIVAHTVYLINQAIELRAQGANGSLYASQQDWLLLAAWGLIAVYLYLAYHYPKTPFGLVMLPLALALIGMAWTWAAPEPPARMPASLVLGIVHGTSVLLATVAVLFGFSAGLMYLGQARRLKRKAPLTQGLWLPSLEWLQRTNSRAIAVALLMVAVGIVSGWGLSVRQLDSARRWTDPVVLTTLAMFLWLLASWSAGFFYKPAREGRKVAYFTVVSFVFLLLVIALAMALTQHTGGRPHTLVPHSSLPAAIHALPGRRV